MAPITALPRARMRFAYADPPYLGCGAKLYGALHKDAAACDDPAWHGALVQTLCDDFPDGWAMSASSVSLRTILPLCPADVRVMAWVKPFASFKPNVPLAYTWEPVILRGGRRRGRDKPTVRDHLSASITLERGLTGVKPASFCYWIFDALGMMPQDELRDVFPGSGAVTQAWYAWRRRDNIEQFVLNADALPEGEQG